MRERRCRRCENALSARVVTGTSFSISEVRRDGTLFGDDREVTLRRDTTRGPPSPAVRRQTRRIGLFRRIDCLKHGPPALLTIRHRTIHGTGTWVWSPSSTWGKEGANTDEPTNRRPCAG